MTATQVIAASPFGVLKGDTYPVPSVRLSDENGDPIDPSGWTITLKRWTPAGAESEMASTVASGIVTFPWLTDDTIADAEWETMVSIDDTTNVYSLVGPNLYVWDTALMWCSVADVVAIVGPGYSQYEILAAIHVAESVIRAWVTGPVGSPVPDRVRQATALLAARVLTSGSGTGGDDGSSIIEERIADYSVRYADPQTGSPWIIDGDLAELLKPWRTGYGMTNIAEDRAPTDTFDEEGYTTLGGTP